MGNDRVILGAKLLMMCSTQCLTQGVLNAQVQLPGCLWRGWEAGGQVLFAWWTLRNLQFRLVCTEKRQTGARWEGVPRSRSRCPSSQMGGLTGMRPLAVFWWWWWACLAPWEKNVWLLARGKWLSGLAMRSWNKEVPALWLSSLFCSLGSDGISCVLVGAISGDFWQISNSDSSSHGACYRAISMGGKWEKDGKKQRSRGMCVCVHVCVLAPWA